MSRPKLLDLFSCAGGAAMGYHRAGFEVVGVDIDPQPKGKPYVIENVADASWLMEKPVRICGAGLGMPIRRHRLFESDLPLVGIACDHKRFSEPRYWTGWRPKGEKRLSTVVQVYGNAGGKHEWPAAMGIDWATYDEIAEAIPPAYTEFIGRQVIAHLWPDPMDLSRNRIYECECSTERSCPVDHEVTR